MEMLHQHQNLVTSFLVNLENLHIYNRERNRKQKNSLNEREAAVEVENLYATNMDIF